MTIAPRWAVFDLDATLYPADCVIWQEIRARIVQYMLERMGLDVNEVSVLRERYLQQFGTTLAGLQHDFPEIDPDDYLAYVHDVPYERHLGPNSALDQMLADLSLEKAIFTNADAAHAQRVLSLLGIERHFPTVVDIRATNFVNKPDPRAFAVLFDTIKAKPTECIFIEDSIRNLDTASKLGMTTVLVCPDKPSRNLPHHHVMDITAVANLIHSLPNYSPNKPDMT